MAIPDLILASASKARQVLLSNAGIAFEVIPADIDEDAVKTVFLKDNPDADLADLAMILAQTKAASVSDNCRGKLVIGADQILIHDNKLFNKPQDRDAASDQLLHLRGHTHTLESAVACALDGDIIWSTRDAAHLTMRNFTPEFLGQYLSVIGDNAFSSVGGYQLEGPGVQLFERIEGDYFTILGLPLLPLLKYLRQRKILES